MFNRNKWTKRSPNNGSNDGEIDFLLSDGSSLSTDDPYIKPVRATDVIPTWYKDLPAKALIREGDEKEDFTIKRCIPVLDALTTGYYFVTKFDMIFTYNEKTQTTDITGNFNPNKIDISTHPINQLGDMPISPEYVKYAYKWGNQYTIKTPPGYSTLFTHPVNAPHLPFYSLTGVVDTDKYFLPVLFPFLIKNNFNGVLPAGTPIIQVIPFKRDNWTANVYDSVPDSFMKAQYNMGAEYEKLRYDKDKEAIGGMYKRDYREKKKYL